MLLSKSDYMLFLRHPAWLWLKKFDKGTLPAELKARRQLYGYYQNKLLTFGELKDE